MRNLYARNLAVRLFQYGTLHFGYFKYKCKIPKRKRREDFTLSGTLRKSKHALASLMIPIVIPRLPKRNFRSPERRHVFPSILGAENFQADILYLKCRVSITQHFHTVWKWIEFPSVEERTWNHGFGVPSRSERDVVYWWTSSATAIPSRHSKRREDRKILGMLNGSWSAAK